MGILSKLFGYEGKVRFKGITNEGKKFTGKVEVETFNMNNKEIEEKIKNYLFVEYGYEIRELTIIGMT
jgi:hypothetical protein